MKQKDSYPIPLLALAIHIVSLAIVFIILKAVGVFHTFPGNSNLVRFDALWYDSIAKDGYAYTDGQNNMAFFPLFAYIWKLTGSNAVGISILNGAVYLSGMYMLIRHLKLTLSQALLILSTPSLFFCYIPYSEAFFFLGSTLILIGLDKKSPLLTLGGAVITGFTRSVGIVFFPAIIFTLLIHWKKGEWKVNRRHLITTGWFCLIISVAAALVIFFQYIETGESFVFFRVQKYWRRSFGIPTLPFTTLSGIKILWLDGCAFLVAIVAAVICFRSLGLFMLKGEHGASSRSTDFSLAYLAVMGFVCSFFSGIWDSGSGTSLMSINRYIFAGPFMILFINRTIFSNLSSSILKDSMLVLSIIIFTWCLLGAFGKPIGLDHYWQSLLYFTCMTLYLLLYYCIRIDSRVSGWLYIINLFLQMYLYNKYISNQWVG